MSRTDKNKGRKTFDRKAGTNPGKGRPKASARKSKPTAPKPDGPKQTRLNKYIANAGICSRREADTLIAAGNVTVNGKTVTEMGFKVSPGDEVRFDGRLLQAEKKEYVLLNKPKNFITTTRDEKGRRTVMELVSSASSSRLLPVGRLDRLGLSGQGLVLRRTVHPGGQPPALAGRQ